MAAGSHHWWLPFINCREPPNGSPFLTAGSHPSLILLSSLFLLSPFFFSPLFISCIFLLSFFLSLIFLSFYFLSFFFLYIHVFLQSPLNLKLFATFIAFKFLPFHVCFHMRLYFPKFIKSFIKMFAFDISRILFLPVVSSSFLLNFSFLFFFYLSLIFPFFLPSSAQAPAPAGLS